MFMFSWGQNCLRLSFEVITKSIPAHIDVCRLYFLVLSLNALVQPLLLLGMTASIIIWPTPEGAHWAKVQNVTYLQWRGN
jgi:hypothetical protein